MASQAFKQQCPSCEAMVPIRDAGLIGRKIDCPKCKYRFVVEEPDAAPGDDDEAPPAKGKKVVPAKGAKGNKGGKDEDASAKKKKAGTSSTTTIGIAVAGVAVLALVVVYFSGMFGGGSSTPKPSNPSNSGGPVVNNTNVNNNNTTPVDGGENKDKDGTKTETPAANTFVDNSIPAGDITNYLPPETQYVVWARVEELLRTDLKSLLLSNASPFKKADFAKKFHFPVDSITQLVQAHNLEKGWIFTIMRTTSDIPMKELEKSLVLKAEPTVKGRTYYSINGTMDSLGNVLFKSGLAHPKFTLHKLDRNTLVFADAVVMADFLAAGTKYKHQTTPLPTAEKKKEEPKETKEPEKPANPTDVSPPRPEKGGTRVVGPDMGNADDKSKEKPKEKIELPGVSGQYLTINRELKSILDRMRTSEEPPLICVAGPFKLPADFELARAYKKWIQMAGDYAITAKLVEKAVTSYDKYCKPFTTEVRELERPLREVVLAGVGLYRIKMEKVEKKPEICKLNVVVAADTASESSASTLDAAASKLFAKIQDSIAKDTGPVETIIPTRPNNAGGIGPRSDGGAPQFGVAGAAVGSSAKPPLGPLSDRPGMRPPDSSGGIPGSEGAKGSEEPVTIAQLDTTVVGIFDLTFDRAEYYKPVEEQSAQGLVMLKGQADIANTRSRVHDLAAATQAYLKAKGQFPRGTLERKMSGNRLVEWSPDQRVSWMGELLPFLGPEFPTLVESRFDPSKSWSEGENLSLARRVVPLYVEPSRTNAMFMITYPGVPGLVAATHYVGVAGVGLDAAEYDPKDLAVAKKLGVFGYDRVTKPDDIKDGLGNTILLLQIPAGPADQKSPWMAGGGSTVRGISEDAGCVRPFVCAERDGKKGTYAIMCDGKVRFIPETIPPELFRAMCTINGNESMDKLDEIAPVVEPGSMLSDASPEAAKPKDDAAKIEAPTAWMEYVAKADEGNFKILLPGKPVYAKASQKSGDVTYDVHIYTVPIPDAGSDMISISVMPNKEEPKPDDSAQALEWFEGNQLKTPGTKLLSKKDIALDGKPGREFEFSIASNDKLKVKAAFIANNLYVVSVKNGMGKVKDAQLQAMFDSFHVNK